MKSWLVSGLVILFSSQSAFGLGKFDILGGYYSLSAKAESGEGNAANLGSYVATYHYTILSDLDFSVGYSLFFSGIVSGDMGYGPDLGFTYYPISHPSSVVIQTERIAYYFEEEWRPFVNFSFHQRQFQSVEAAYAGFSLGFGVEKNWTPRLDWKAMGRYQLLKGPQQSTASQIDLFVGISFGI